MSSEVDRASPNSWLVELFNESMDLMKKYFISLILNLKSRKCEQSCPTLVPKRTLVPRRSQKSLALR